MHAELGQIMEEVEGVYRSGLRTALGIRTSINNEIVYIESDRFPLKCKIKKQQLKFWLHVKDYISTNPRSALDIFVLKPTEIDLPFIRYYRELEGENLSPASCLVNFESELKGQWRSKFEAARNDGRLGCYLKANKTLSKSAYHTLLLWETGRLLLSRFRCGSHSLLIEIGRFNNIPLNERCCSCNMGVQKVLHCFKDCPLTISR